MTAAQTDAPRGASEKLRAAVFSSVIIALALAPGLENWSDAPRDGFPFSYYPMFSERIGETYGVTHAVGLDLTGNQYAIPYRYLGVGGLNEVLGHMRREARSDPDALCARIAAELSQRAPRDLKAVREVRVLTGQYLMQPFYEGRIEARAAEERARCRVVP